MNIEVFDNTACQLGEGVLWHPERRCLFWVDIERQILLCRGDVPASNRRFEKPVSALGWIDCNHLLVACSDALLRYEIDGGAIETVCPLEADNPVTRANDGRADPWGGFWIGTMGKKAEPEAGAIYRFFKGELRKLHAPVTIPNAICFSPDADFAYFADTMRSKVWRQTLDQKNGWPRGEPELFLDISKARLFPDGAVCDEHGFFWVALWGAAQLARYQPDGTFDMKIDLPAAQVTCPGFGGPSSDRLFVTTAAVGLAEKQLADQPDAGKTFCITDAPAHGQKEHQVVL